jgi:hypothetical protein
MPPEELGAEKGDDATKPSVQEPELTSVDQNIGQRWQSDSPSGRLRYPDNPDIVESGRTVGEGY